MRYFIAAMIWLTATFVQAQTITVHIPYSKTGNAQATTRLLLDGLEQRGWRFDERVTSNPVLSKETFANSREPMLLLWGTDLVPSRTHAGYRPVPAPQELVTVTYVSPRFICAANNSNVNLITAEQFASRNRVLTIGTTVVPADEQYLSSLNQHLGTRHRVVKYTNSRELEAAVAAREVDMVMVSVGLRLEQQNRVHCIFNTSQYRVGSTPLVTDQHPHMQPPNFAGVSYLVARGMDAATMNRLRQDMITVQREYQPYLDYLKRNFNPSTPLLMDQQLRVIQELDRTIP
jgi:hypothetical protein